jgi:deoxyribodipyrimidine photo-lyase
VRVAIVLFTRNLRVHDNLALSTAAREAEQVVPLFVFDDAILGGNFARPNRVAFLLDALRDLDASLTSRGARLVVRSGDVVAETVALARQVGAETVFIAEDASGYAQGRRQRLEDACRGDRMSLRVTPGVTVAPLTSIETSSGGHYSVFTPFHRAWSKAPRRPVERAPRRVTMPSDVRRGRLPALGGRVAGSPSPELTQGGEAAGRRRLSAWLRSGVGGYAAGHDDLAADATSHLSPYLHFGCISPLEVAQRAGEVAGSEPFLRQLAWRDFFHQLLASRPETLHEDMRPRGNRWSSDSDALEAWQQGRTGYPIVDAGMRQLLREGYMHNRARLITASRPQPAHRLAIRSSSLLRLARGRRRGEQRRQLAVGRRHGCQPASRASLQPAEAGASLRPRRRVRPPLCPGAGRDRGTRGSRAVEAANNPERIPASDRRARLTWRCASPSVSILRTGGSRGRSA